MYARLVVAMTLASKKQRAARSPPSCTDQTIREPRAEINPAHHRSGRSIPRQISSGQDSPTSPSSTNRPRPTRTPSERPLRHRPLPTSAAARATSRDRRGAISLRRRDQNQNLGATEGEMGREGRRNGAFLKKWLCAL